MLKMTGKEVADKIYYEIKQSELNNLLEGNLIAIVTVGNDEASKIYVRNKIKRVENLGGKVLHITLSEDVDYKNFKRVIEQLNDNYYVKGIIIQKPLPKHLEVRKIDELISLDKDVDGFRDESWFVPCTPLAVMKMLKYYNIAYEGKFVVIAGRSDLVSKPLANLLMEKNCTVVMVHSHTPVSLVHSLIRECDIFISAIGKPHYWTSELFKGLQFKKHAVIDIGISRDDEGKIKGDIHPDVYRYFDAYTPVPEGVGVVTVATFVGNCVEACTPF